MPEDPEKKEYQKLVRPKVGKPEIIDVPSMTFLMVDGEGDPNKSPAYMHAIAALYAAGYTLKFERKRDHEAAPVSIGPLEGLWWADDMSDFTKSRKSGWKWTAFVMVTGAPTAVELRKAVAAAQARAGKKKEPANPKLPEVRLQKWKEGRVAQVMHIGPYDAEAPTISALHDFIKEQSCQLRDRHHEIYLSDPRRTAPEKLKTVIRQPIRKG